MSGNKNWLKWTIFFVCLAGVFILGMGIAMVLGRRAETRLAPVVSLDIPENETDPTVWGKVFPREYSRFLMTQDTTGSTKYGGPTPFSWLERDTLLRFLWAGYPFSVEYNEDRGHVWTLVDLKKTARRDPARGGKTQKGMCLTCKSSEVPGLMNEMGLDSFYSADLDDLLAKAKHPVSCSDCHDPKTMELRITRPALSEALLAMGKDTARLTRQELRSLVCAQCHSEYFFAGEPKRLIFPWKYGTGAEAMFKLYEEMGFSDWIHPTSGTPLIKVQHPDYEIFLSGPHAQAGLACADCHMPYITEGGLKFTDHHIQSPLKDISRACKPCHEGSEGEIKARVEIIQDRNHELLQTAELALTEAHRAIADAEVAGTTDEDLKGARALLRKAQFLWDYVFSANSMGFHAPQEAARILGEAIDLARQAQVSGLSAQARAKGGK
ncbi:MAG: ammonia-forming cytochrome c nitrite reductase subunit c552 [candidate division WOR-3 bacterium]